MIYAKTKLKKIPKTCARCPYSLLDGFFSGIRDCRFTLKECPAEVSENGRVRYGKPSWCPLTEVGK